VEAVTAAVNEIYSKYASTLNSGDSEGWLSQWTDDGVQMPPGAPPNIGKEMIRTSITNGVTRFTFDMEISNEEVRVAGDWAFARGTYKSTMTPKEGGEPIVIDGKYMTVFERQPDGTWKIHRDIFNSNVPPNQ
jgi:uncharacterized protein (TIGR02246 family)